MKHNEIDKNYLVDYPDKDVTIIMFRFISFRINVIYTLCGLCTVYLVQCTVMFLALFLKIVLFFFFRIVKKHFWTKRVG